MTYTEACRVAEEASRWIRNTDAERVVRLAQLEKAQGVIRATLNIDPITVDENDPPPAPAAEVVPFPAAEESEYANGASHNG